MNGTHRVVLWLTCAVLFAMVGTTGCRTADRDDGVQARSETTAESEEGQAADVMSTSDAQRAEDAIESDNTSRRNDRRPYQPRQTRPVDQPRSVR